MKYRTKDIGYDIIGPGTAGVAQRISSKYKISEEIEGKETSGLFALMRNDIMTCGRNQY